MPVVTIHTDGSCLGNPGPGGYGVILKCAGHIKEMSEGFSLTTNNRMELLAVIDSLSLLKKQYQKVRIEQGYVRVYDEQDVEGIVKYLMDHKIVPNEIKKNKVGLEEYYINLMNDKEAK